MLSAWFAWFIHQASTSFRTGGMSYDVTLHLHQVIVLYHKYPVPQNSADTVSFPVSFPQVRHLQVVSNSQGSPGDRLTICTASKAMIFLSILFYIYFIFILIT